MDLKFVPAMSNIVENWLKRLSHSGFKLLVLFVHELHKESKEFLEYTQTDFCKESGLCQSSVRTALKELERFNLIKVQVDRPLYGGKSTKYFLNLKDKI